MTLCLGSNKSPIHLFYVLIYPGKVFAERADHLPAFCTVTHIPTWEPPSTTTVVSLLVENSSITYANGD